MKLHGIKNVLLFISFIALICIAFSVITLMNNKDNSNAQDAESTVITLTIGDPEMTVNGEVRQIDPGNNTVPVIINDRTLLPVRAIIEAVGGGVEWNEANKEVTITYDENEIRMVIDSTTAYVNGKEENMDVAPVLLNDRTMLPIRFIAENFDFAVEWDNDTRTVRITASGSGNTENSENNNGEEVITNMEHNINEESAPIVYFTSEISPEALMNIYNQLNFQPVGNVAIKLSTGEAGNTHYLDPDLIKNLVQSVDGTIVECNTAYGGSRANTAMHMQVAEDHGFTEIADVDIMDADGSIELAVSDKAENLERDIVGKNYENYDSMLVLSHFKGHAMGGFGGAIKNISIGVSSSEGKMYIHSAGHSTTSWSGGTQDQFLESMAEAAQAVHNDKQNNGGIIYINVMNHLSVDCDCDGNPAEPEMNDVGILASYDPVAIDQACVDIVYNTDRSESAALIERIESRNGEHTLEHAAKIGLGSREYRLISID